MTDIPEVLRSHESQTLTILHPHFRPSEHMFEVGLVKVGQPCCWTSLMANNEGVNTPKFVDYNGLFILTSNGAERVSEPQEVLCKDQYEILRSPNLYRASGIFVYYFSKDLRKAFQQILNTYYLEARDSDEGEHYPYLRNLTGPTFNSTERPDNLMYDDEVISKMCALGKSGSVGLQCRNYSFKESLPTNDIQVFDVNIIIEERNRTDGNAFNSTRTYVQSLKHLGDSRII